MKTGGLHIPPHIFWPGMVVALLCMSLTAATITVIVAVSDPSFAVEEDYYGRALRWDEQVAQRSRNAELGWSAEIAVGGGGPGGPELRVTLLDRAGEPIEGAAVTATYFHHAFRGEAETIGLAGVGAGGYAAPAAMGRSGKWSVSLAVTARGETFTADETLTLVWGEVGGS